MSVSGTTYGDRYSVFERVGAGGMAEVYRARDELLGRDVALKVLSERFARDSSFVERFRREAQSAANLNHPQIVSLYDYGSDGDAYFIVMEFIDGTSLADIIHREAPLLPERAAEIALDVTRALDRAHTAGIVHRDIKPGNILITKDGNTKVTDFGIARAARGDNEQTMTQTGMVIGTAAYLSPEQAQGEPVDGRSDLYSLGVVLYEMLSGHAPFAGDTPLAIAYKHVREFAAPPSSINPDVPKELDAIVMKALAKNPENRYQNAVEFEQDLQRFLSGQKVHATPLMGDETQVVGALPATATQVLRPDSSTAVIPPPESSRTGWYLLSALGILLLFGLAGWLLFNNLLGGSPAPKVKVPNVVGKDLATAKTILQSHHLKATVHKQRSGKPDGQVLAQDPPAGGRLDRDSTVTLTVSGGPGQTLVPNITGTKLSDAKTTLEDHHLTLGTQTKQPSDTIPKNSVISQDPPPGARVARGSPVDVVVSSGLATVTVPSVVGKSQDDAVNILHDAGLHVSINQQPSDTVPKGQVISQDPAAGSDARRGQTVTILVSQGPQSQALPDVTGQNADQAQQMLEQDFGLVVTQMPYTAGSPCTFQPGDVCTEDPSPGTQVSPGDAVTLFVQQ
ncbi:MAG TPA: Stk1 family PASTA domain-containing Ser/Thr kinase [Actinomycetota bacterium]|nr:Stk1 family PASTA domain-containing Ser/Thr kinase [Actinomycetota bacterium]